MIRTKNHNDPHGLLRIPVAMVQLEYANKRYESAINIAERTRATPEYKSDHNLAATVLSLTEAQAALALHRAQLADDRIKEGLSVCKMLLASSQEPNRALLNDTMVQLLTTQAYAKLALGRAADAVNCCEIAEQYLSEQTNPAIQSSFYISRGQMYACNKQFTKSITAMEKAANLYRRQNNLKALAACTKAIDKLRIFERRASSVNPISP
jgi:tetratricopeptide (TPR) repeat protein